MIVYSHWLADYVDWDLDAEALADRLSMSGLNLEELKRLDDGFALDLEVTSNRPDCLGHIGVAREIAVLLNQTLRIKDPQPTESGPSVADQVKVQIECPELCSRYSARIIRNVQVGPSPEWLAKRLEAIGQPVINNIVDVTNYVMMESGQPLHAFDLAKLGGPGIIVRRSEAGEEFEAIDHRTYALDGGMCVIADGDRRAVALGGVMGGADTEVGLETTDLLIEAAEFAPLSIRTTARRLKLHSPSSYRFERRVDSQGVDWASRRCCELILDVAGGQLAAGVVDVGSATETIEPVALRYAQLPRVLGVTVATEEVTRILSDLGCEVISTNEERIEVRPPSWRRDLTREIDLIEEVARVHGYEQIPEDVGVPMAPSHKPRRERVLDRVRSVLTAAGLDEALTATAVSQEWSDAFSPWTDQPPLRCRVPMIQGAEQVRRSLIPSLLGARQINESLSNPRIELFETAAVYLPQADGLPREQWTLGIASGRDFRFVKGVVETLVETLQISERLGAETVRYELLDSSRSCRLSLGDRTLAILGEIALPARKQFKLRGATTVAELDLTVLEEAADLIPIYSPPSRQPAIARDLNVIVEESLSWGQLEQTVRGAAGPCLESLSYLETYRDPQADGPDKKRLLFAVSFRSDETLTSEQADQFRDQIVVAIEKQHAGKLLG